MAVFDMVTYQKLLLTQADQKSAWKHSHSPLFRQLAYQARKRSIIRIVRRSPTIVIRTTSDVGQASDPFYMKSVTDPRETEKVSALAGTLGSSPAGVRRCKSGADFAFWSKKELGPNVTAKPILTCRTNSQTTNDIRLRLMVNPRFKKKLRT